MIISAIYSSKTRNAFLFPHVITSLAAIRGIDECLSPLETVPCEPESNFMVILKASENRNYVTDLC